MAVPEKKRKLRRTMNYASSINKRSNEIDPLSTVGASGLTWANKFSTVRVVMEARQNSQRVVLNNPEFAMLFTGTENPYGERSSFNRKADDDYQITKICKKFKDFDTSEIVYFMKSVNTGRYKCEIFEAGVHHNVEKYGFKMINHLTKKHEGDFIAKGEILQQSSSYVDDNYCAGLNARTLYTVLGELTEDSSTISKSFSKRAGYISVDPIKVMLNKNSFMLNTYGDDNIYKSFPNVGEEIKNDVLLSIRENSYVSSKKEAKISHINDQDKISHGTVVDITVYTNVDIENEQINYYHKCCIDYYTEIYSYISMIANDRTQDDTGILDLFHKAEKYLSKAVWVTKENIIDTEIDFVVKQPMDICVGQKLVGRYGNKTVVSQIVDDELMPKTDDGRPIEILSNGLSINNRIIFMVLYEETITFMLERLRQNAIRMKEEGASNEDIIEPIIRFSNIFYDGWANQIRKKFDRNPEKSISDILNNGVILNVPPITDLSFRDAILQAYDEFDDIFKKYKVLVKLRHRWIELPGEYAIGYQYTWILKQEPTKSMSAVATGRTTLYDQPIKTKQFNKNNAKRYSDNPIKFGEYDTYNFLAGITVSDFAKITTYFRGSQYSENSVLMSALNNTKIDTEHYNDFPQLEQLTNILKFFGEKFRPSIFGYGTSGGRDDVQEVFFNNVLVKIPTTELRHILIIYSYFVNYRSSCGGIVDMAKFYDNMYNVEDIWIGYDMKYREYILHKFASMLSILDQLKVY